MKTLLEGLRKFRSEIYPQQKPLFDQLSRGQSPHTLLITCSDSRIDPSLVTQTQPGEIFVVRNAGNIIPPYGATEGGEEASIEFAIDGLKVSNIVVCGHTKCGAMTALMNPKAVAAMPAVSRWLIHAEATRRCCAEGYQAEDPASQIGVIERNVLTQVHNLKTQPAVAAAMAAGKVHVFGWVYHIESGLVSVYDPSTERFVLSSEVKTKAEGDLARYAI